MTLQQLKYAAAVATCGSVSEAARRVFVTQPTLTEAVRTLEEELRVAIFTRTPKGVTVTREGEGAADQRPARDDHRDGGAQPGQGHQQSQDDAGAGHEGDRAASRQPLVPQQPLDAGDDQHDADDPVQQPVEGAGMGEDPHPQEGQDHAARQLDQPVGQPGLPLLVPARHACAGGDEHADAQHEIQQMLGLPPEDDHDQPHQPHQDPVQHVGSCLHVPLSSSRFVYKIIIFSLRRGNPACRGRKPARPLRAGPGRMTCHGEKAAVCAEKAQEIQRKCKTDLVILQGLR